jgi:hypothetical protein
MKSLFTIQKVIFTGLLSLLFACHNIAPPTERKTKHLPSKNCEVPFSFENKTFKSIEMNMNPLLLETRIIDSLILAKNILSKEKTTTRFGNFEVYRLKLGKSKIISEIFIKNIKLASTKHEVYFVDDCTIIAKMTKFMLHSTRVKAVYYFLYSDQKYAGSIVQQSKTIFHRSDKWVNISDDILATNWSKRIYHNIIAPHLLKK